MDDLISRQAAIDAMKELCEHYTPTKSVKHPHINFVIEELKHLPSAQPEIIRCKDCMHNGSFDTDCPIKWEGRSDEDFCSYAEVLNEEAMRIP